MSFEAATLVTELETLRDYLRWSFSQFNQSDIFYGHGATSAWDEAVELLAGSLHLPRDIDGRLLDSKLTTQERKHFISLVDQRINQRLPVPYLTGRAFFCDLEFKVDSRVIVPRSPIAELIQQQFSPWLTEEPARVLDMCTGSGCIAIACAYAFPDAEVVGADISDDAMEVNAINGQRLDPEGQVRFVKSNLFSNLSGESFDLIVSNPPYVDARDLSEMPKEFHAEPEISLGSGEDGLDLTLKMLAQAPDYLNDGGLLIVEVGNSWVALDEMIPEVGLIWIDFENGGHGVFATNKEQLLAHRPRLKQLAAERA
ncbi:50S ribosomal protein L3 N(5)-glutamine methyltransferase [Pelagibaculum spongiae]|uniref:Ribosomal protein uL3 glutamine methyltransferase n=1 Tax=Pelagibaculum spongiae TaxID=2080658 RepID=A0A2V1GST9_9GAMM|nr:50S ribosomal protein L3 N(5)-glutamine methyltransferase [Pelagibaculum spongiae]PVZ66667.1 50S ribosomal protein L3 N(5)-glutamine methyltransferase [Pelagibaculum spongiae]